MTVTPYSDGLGNTVCGLSELGEFAGGIVFPDWCGMTPEEAVKSLLTGDCPPWITLLTGEQFSAARDGLRACGEPFDVS